MGLWTALLPMLRRLQANLATVVACNCFWCSTAAVSVLLWRHMLLPFHNAAGSRPPHSMQVSSIRGDGTNCKGQHKQQGTVTVSCSSCNGMNNSRDTQHAPTTVTACIPAAVC